MNRVSHIDEIELCKKAQQGDKVSLEKMIESNIGLIHKLAGKMYFKNPQFCYEDLFQEGIFGLIRAIQKFDCTKGCRFSTYAYPWIRSFIGRYNQNNRGKIRIPSHITDKLSKLDKESDEYKQIKDKLPVVVSIDTLIGDSFTIGDTIADDKTTNNVEFELILEKIESILTEREFNVLMYRFGIGCDERKTHRECADMFDVTYGTIFNIEKKAIRKLQSHFNQNND